MFVQPRDRGGDTDETQDAAAAPAAAEPAAAAAAAAPVICKECKAVCVVPRHYKQHPGRDRQTDAWDTMHKFREPQDCGTHICLHCLAELGHAHL